MPFSECPIVRFEEGHICRRRTLLHWQSLMLRVIFFVLLLLGCRCGQGYGEEDKWRGHSRGYHSHARHFANHFNPSDSVDMANQLMAMKTVYDGIDRSNRTNRLAVMILFAYGAELVKKIIFLKCALKTLQQHMDQTPMDIFIWTLQSSTASELCKELDGVKKNVICLTIQQNSWIIPEGLKDNSTWSYRQYFKVDYYLMGQWRLIFAPGQIYTI